MYHYSIVSGPLPIANYMGKVRVFDSGERTSLIEFSSEFDASGVSESDATKAVEAVYQAGAENLQRMVGG